MQNDKRVSKREFLQKIQEYEIVEIRELASYLELSYAATKMRFSRYRKRGLVHQPMPGDRSKYCLTALIRGLGS